MFWSSSYGSSEGWFAADLGPGYRFREEGTPSAQERTLDFASFGEIWSVPIEDLSVRKLRAPPTYVKFKLFEAFRCGLRIYLFAHLHSKSHIQFNNWECGRDMFGRLPGYDDASALRMVASSELAEGEEMEVAASALAVLQTGGSLPWTNCGLPVCSVIGGVLAQEVIKVTTKTGAPIDNFFIFSTDDYGGRSLCVKKKR